MKRPWLMAAWPLLLLFYSSATLTAVVDSNKNNDARLKVSIRKDTMLGVPSCQHTFSQIELLNMHSSEPIMIYSIQTIPEETVLVRPESSPSSSPSSPQGREPEYGRSWSGNDIPQQLHVSKLPSKSLSLGPGQVAIVPVTFLPRYPSAKDCEGSDSDDGDDYDKTKNIDDDYSTTTSDGRSPSPLSPTARLDLVDLVGERVLKVIDNKRQHLGHTVDPTYRRRNNMNPDSLPKGDEKYDVTTTVIVDTSRGVVKLPIAASSIRQNSFNIPDVVHFHHPSFANNNENCNTDTESDDEFDNYDMLKVVPRNKSRVTGFASMDGITLLDTVRTTDKHEHADEKNNRASALDTIKSERECFDLYLSNPFLDRELQIMEALVSRPEFTSVQFDPGRMAAPDLTMLVGSGPSQVVRQWTLDGPLYLPPESDDHYILSICTAFEGEIERDEGSETYLDEMSKWIDSGDPTRNLGFLQIRTDAETLFIGLEHAENVPYLSLTNGPHLGLKPIQSNTDSNPLTLSDRSETKSTLLRSLPDRMDFEMISTTSPAIRATFGLQNKSPVPIRIMRLTVGIDSAGDKENAKDAELLGLQLKVGVKTSGGDEAADDSHDGNFSRQLDSLVLGATASLDDIFELTCSLDPDRFISDSNKEAFSFSGTVIIRGTMDTELSYNQWREEILRNPYRDEHLTVELPFTVSVLNGRVEALIERSSHPYPQLFAAQSSQGSGRAVSHLFFPMNQYVAVEGSEDGLPQQTYVGANEIRHDLRILSNMVVPLKLMGAQIIDDEANNTDSLCNRFNVSTSSPSNLDDLYSDFEDIGLLSVKYKFGTKGKRGERQQELFPENIDSHLPKKCSLVVMTSSDEVGTFQIPLLIFPGRLEVTSMDSTVLESSKENRALLGFGHLLSWCLSSPLGKSFVETLRKSSKAKNDAHLLSKFILENSGWDTKSKPKFLPILLKIGAIDSGKISKMQLYLTNHNPIPLSVSIDVGEVEGMSITLSRDESQATGDGNSLLDHFPSHRTGALVQSGKNKDHPVAGLLDFLTSNEQALELMSKFNFRDSLSLHEPAVEGSDVLRLLHDWHSKATFYRDQHSSQSNWRYSSQCENNVRPPVYNSFNTSQKETNAEGLSSPLIYSSDRRLARPLKECWRRDPTDTSTDRNIVRIPPGARARFEIQVRAPPQSYLNDDISHLLISGLILSTNLGDVMPIFAVTEALQGQLRVASAKPTEPLEVKEERKVMSVPLQLSWNSHHHPSKQSNGEAINIPPANWTSPTFSDLNDSYHLGDEIVGNGVPLYLKSSFSRNVGLLDVESCNPWFSFVPLESSNITEHSSSDGTLVGFIRTNADCSTDHSSEFGFPSFYQCVLNWFSDRLKLQPEGCGIKDSNLNLRQIDSVKRTIEAGLRRLKTSYKPSVSSDVTSIDLTALGWNQSDLSHVKTGRRKNDGLISDLASYDTILKALKTANDLGYNLLSSSLKATVEYDPENSNKRKDASFNAASKQNLSLTIGDLEVESVLELPKLFDSDNDRLEFKPTTVGSVARSLLSVRNPTGVPVRVRLGIAPTKRRFDDTNQVENARSPYIQNGKSSIPTNESTAYSWWDGNGGFFIPNEEGDVIRSHNNVSVTGGGGTTSISLVNPSLNSQVGFLVGCVKRCGLRDKSNPSSFIGNPISTSPIGASAASGTTLKGSIRYDSPELNKDQTTVEPVILAADTSASIVDGPAAFAIPFSALDEIVIPPFGIGQLGPIYFRPPGRHKAVGCDVAKQSGARLREEKETLCESQIFESVVYLENSLTGIEEVGLLGKSVWNQLYFIDPPPQEGEDAFGDIEFRNGISTLMFSGTSNTVIDSGTKLSVFGKSAQQLSVVKEIVLQNGGDAASEIETVSLFGTSSDTEQGGSCSYGSFRLLNCWESVPQSENAAILDVNIHSSFVLQPGENRSLFVEHIADCGMKQEFVTLHVELRQDRPSAVLKPGRSRSRGTENPFEKTETRMAIGYQMDASTYARCMPVDTRVASTAIHLDPVSSMNHANYSSRVELKSFDNGPEENPVLIFQFFLFATAALILCYALHARFHAILAMLQKIQGEPTKNVRNWNAAFRCLARSQPTSTELQTMSREQMRQDVIGRYKAKGNTPSSSLNSTNGFSRDRRTAMSKTSRHRTGREGSSGNERTRPFSEALFHDTSLADDSSLRLHFPVGLGWRTAYSRGIIKDNSLQLTSFRSRAKALLDKRAEIGFGDDENDWSEESDNEVEMAENDRFFTEGKQNPSSSHRNIESSNGANKAVVENTLTETTTVASTSRIEERKSSEVKTHDTNGEEWKKTTRTNPGRGAVPAAEDAKSTISTERKERSSRSTGRLEKQDSPAQHPKNVNTSEVSRRTQKAKNTSTKSIESDNSKKLDRSSKHAPLQKQKAAAKSATPGTSPKANPPNAWQGERQKPDSRSATKKEVARGEKKSKAKDKPKKKTAKQTAYEKKSASDSGKQTGIDSALFKDTGATAKPVLSPPPGFGAPNSKVNLHPVSATDSQLSLDTMLHPTLTGGSNEADLSLGASSQLPFRHANTGATDLLFSNANRESNLSPTRRGFNVEDVGTKTTTENPSTLPSPAEQSWLPALRNEDAESGFDVMDFLDGILNDGSSAQQEPTLETEPAAHGTPGRMGVGGNSSSTPVSANPWARESRAAAYGISFDEEEDTPKASTAGLEGILKASPIEKALPPGLGGNIPLFTPAAILNAEGNKSTDEEDDKAMSFYAGLIDE